MIKLSFEILGKKWQLRILRRRKYAKKNGKDSIAITYMEKRRIDLSPFGLDRETIVHELVHAYIYELSDAKEKADLEAQEELFAELLAKYGDGLLELATDLHERVKQATTPTVLL